MIALADPFHRFAMDIDGPLQDARAEITACHEMQGGQNAEEPCVQEAVKRLVLSAYGRLDFIRDAHVKAFAQADAAEAQPDEPEPFIRRMAAFALDLDAYNADPEAPDNLPEPSGALCDDIRSGALPIATAEGALVALRRVIALDCLGDSEGECMVDAVIAYLERRA